MLFNCLFTPALPDIPVLISHMNANFFLTFSKQTIARGSVAEQSNPMRRKTKGEPKSKISTGLNEEGGEDGHKVVQTGATKADGVAKGERKAQANADVTADGEGKGTSKETPASSASAASPAHGGDGQSTAPQTAPAPQNEAKLPRGWIIGVHEEEGAPYVVCVLVKRRCATALVGAR